MGIKILPNLLSIVADALRRVLPGRGRARAPQGGLTDFSAALEHFQELLLDHQQAMQRIADMGEKSGGEYLFDKKYLFDVTGELHGLVLRLVKALNLLAANRYADLYPVIDRTFLPIHAELRGRLGLSEAAPYVIPLDRLSLDRPEVAGGKAEVLAQIMQRLRLPVPLGFVITIAAFRRFLQQNLLEERIHAWLESWITEKADEGQISRQIQYSILAGVVPQDLVREIRRHVDRARRGGFWAVRSSAYGEDGELSFAGLHETVLHVSSEGLPEAYKKVLASLYSPEALVFRKRMGIVGQEAAMSVVCQEMVQSQASGVIHTLDLEALDPTGLVIYASLGLGRAVAEGKVLVDRFVVERDPPYRICSSRISEKDRMFRSVEGGGVEDTAVPDEQRGLPSLSEESIATLVRWAMALERYFKRPQEVEWAMDAEGRCWILQSRGLSMPKAKAPPVADLCESCSLYPALIRDRGAVAHAGVGSGPASVVNSPKDMDRFPEGAVLITPYAAPWLARIVPRAAGLISERGSSAGHLAIIAREFRVPALLGVENAVEILQPEAEITLDTHHRVVYRGKVAELMHYEFIQSVVFEETLEFRLLRRLLKRIAPLNLIDPQAQDFTPQGCRTVHDVIRFVHEKSVQELMDLPNVLRRFRGARVWTLVSSVPLGLKILDLGGGIDAATQGGFMEADQIRSLPLKALWEGIATPGAWSTEPVPVDFQGMMSSLTLTPAEIPGAPAHAGMNLAVVSETYMNLHLKLGYHFNLVDARMDLAPAQNHIYFRFVGGVTDITRRSRRAYLLGQILSYYEFKVETRGDLVVARVHDLPREEISHRLQVIGRLIGFTRQLDIQLRSDGLTSQFVERFFRDHAPGYAGVMARGGEDES
jgi:pyruvate,water dikinase